MSLGSRLCALSTVKKLILKDQITGAGKGRRICIVSDSRINLAPTANQLARFFVADGWETTFLDLSTAPEMKRQTIDRQDTKDVYKRVRLSGTYLDRTWYTPLQSLCAWQWLQDKKFDLIVFQHGFGAAYYSLVARQHHLGFAKTPIALFICEVSDRWNETTLLLSPTAPRTEMEINNMEQQSVEMADIVFTLNDDIASWMKNAGWSVNAAVEGVPYLDDKAKQPWGQWLTAAMQQAKVYKKPEKIFISACIVVDDKTTNLADTLESLRTQNSDVFEVVVLNNGKIKESAHQLRKELAMLFKKRGWRWEQQEKTPLHQVRTNVAALAKGTHLLFVENGVTCLPHALKSLTLAHAGSKGDILSSVPAFNPMRGDVFDAVALFPAPSSLPFDKFLVAWAAPGACAALAPVLNIFGPALVSIKRSCLTALGNFAASDENGSDLMTRALLAGMSINILPNILTLHFFMKKRQVRVTSLDKTVNAIREGTRNLPSYVTDAMLNLSKMININPYLGFRMPVGVWHKQFLPGTVPPTVKVPSVFRPKPQAGPINIAMIFDDHYLQTAAVAMISMFSNTKADIEVYAIADLTPDHVDVLHRIGKHYNQVIHFIPTGSVKSKISHGASFHANETNIGHAYLWLTEYLPQKVKRIIFLDADILVRDDIAKLWNVDLDGEIVAAVPEDFFNSLAEARKNNPYHEFNGGVMLLDVAAWRKSTITADAVKWVDHQEKHPHRSILWAQTAFNMAVAGRWMPLPVSWNVTPAILWKHCEMNHISYEGAKWIEGNSSICHFAGPEKPWHKDSMGSVPHGEEYRVYVKVLANLLPKADCFTNL